MADWDRFEHSQRTVFHRKRSRLILRLVIVILFVIYGFSRLAAAIIEHPDGFEYVRKGAISVRQGLQRLLPGTAPSKGSDALSQGSFRLEGGRRFVPVNDADLRSGGRAVIQDVAGSEKHGFVAVGWRQAGKDVNAAVWWSPDGQTWESTSEENLGGSGDQYLHDVAAYSDGFVAAGSDKGFAVVFSSPDGRSWERQHNQQGVFSQGSAQVILGVAARQGMIVAVGARRAQSTAPLAPAAWLREGGTWKKASVAPSEGNRRPKAKTDEVINDVVETSSGYVAVGEAANSDAIRQPTVWISPNGRTWQQLPDSAVRDPLCAGAPCQSEGAINGLVRVGDSLVAVGYVGPACKRAAAVWTSTDDGSTWMKSNAADLSGKLTDFAMSSITKSGASLIAVGSGVERNRTQPDDVSKRCGKSHAVVWTSKDAEEWHRWPRGGIGPPGRMTGVTARRGTTEAVGSDESDTRGIVWRMSP